MSLYEDLKTQVSSEEDVKDLHIKALGLKTGYYKKGRIDIQTEKVWFEAKKGYSVSSYEMFTQILYYVDEAIKLGQPLPTFLCVIDCAKASIMKTADALPLLEKNKIKWGKSACDVTQEAVAQVSQYIGTYLVSFSLKSQEDEYIATVKSAVEHGEILRTQITPNNLKSVFDHWVDMIGKEIIGIEEDNYYLLFYADIMTDGTLSTHELTAQLLHKNGRPSFLLHNKLYELGNVNGYRRFWAIYARPPKEEYRNYLLERRDTLIPNNTRIFSGDFYTPLNVVEKAYELLNRTLGENWQKEYIVWDNCCGVGNLETKHSNPRNCFMSTLNQTDIDIMVSTRTCASAIRFQYDYLNDDITDDGEIDYSLSKNEFLKPKMPEQLRKAIASARSGKKKFLILINPPYAEATNADNTVKGSDAKNKQGVAKSKVADTMMKSCGKATNELFTQFIMRISKEIPNATLAIFSKLKYINAPNFKEFRDSWNAEFLDGFIVHSKAFDGLKGDFPIGFCIWQTHNEPDAIKIPISEICTDVFEKDGTLVGSKKFYNIPKERLINNWIKRPRSNGVKIIPLTNAVVPASINARTNTWCDEAIGYMGANSSDMQNASKYTFLMSSVAGRGNGYYITPLNLSKSAVNFTIRKIIPHTWQNDRDQFLQPNCELPEEFYNDCLIWMLFNGSNLTASADNLDWNGQKWSIVNHFIPFTEDEVGSPNRFESDFMVQFMDGKHFSNEATAVLDAGREIWKQYFNTSFDYNTREMYKLNRCDVGWYQVRQALKQYEKTEIDAIPIRFDAFEEAYETLSSKLRPLVYEYGFLK